MNANIVQCAIASGLIKPPAQQKKKRAPKKRATPVALGARDSRYVTSREAAEILHFKTASAAQKFLVRHGLQSFFLQDRPYLHWNRTSVERAAQARIPRKRPGKEWITIDAAAELTGFHRAHLFVAIKREKLIRRYALLPNGEGRVSKFCFVRKADIINLRQRQPKKH